MPPRFAWSGGQQGVRPPAGAVGAAAYYAAAAHHRMRGALPQIGDGNALAYPSSLFVSAPPAAATHPTA